MIPALVLAAAALTAGQVDSIIAKAEAAFHDYVFPDVAAKAQAALKTNAGRYHAITDPKTLQTVVNSDLYSITHDKHVRLWYPFGAQQPAAGAFPLGKAAEHEFDLTHNFGFSSIRRLPGNVGYIDFHYFSGDADMGKAVQGAMEFLADTDALIIDVRRNGGGDPVAAETIEGYFFDSQQPITSLMWRDPKSGKVSEIQQYTAPTVTGPLYLNKPVYVLTSAHTFSCAEQFVYDLRNLKRITVVGETTGGGANPGSVHDIGNGFGIFIPEGRAWSPVTKTNWEGTGISPDVPSSASDALLKAYALALGYVKTHDTDGGVQAEVKDALASPKDALAMDP